MSEQVWDQTFYVLGLFCLLRACSVSVAASVVLVYAGLLICLLRWYLEWSGEAKIMHTNIVIKRYVCQYCTALETGKRSLVMYF